MKFLRLWQKSLSQYIMYQVSFHMHMQCWSGLSGCLPAQRWTGPSLLNSSVFEVQYQLFPSLFPPSQKSRGLLSYKWNRNKDTVKSIPVTGRCTYQRTPERAPDRQTQTGSGAVQKHCLLVVAKFFFVKQAFAMTKPKLKFRLSISRKLGCVV